MWTHTKIKEILIRLTLILGVVLVPLTSVGKQVFAQSNMPPIWLVRSIYTEEYGLNQPKGLTYSPIANMFFVMDGSANIVLISNGEDNAGIKVLSGVQGEALNVAFDKKTGSLFSFSQGRSELVKIKSDGTGLPDASAAPSRSSLGALGIKNAQGLAFDSENGRLFILDADSSQIVSMASHPTLGFDANEAIRSNKVQKISLKKLGTLKGLAYNPGNGHLYISEPAQKKLYELTQDGDIVSTFDLASLGINNPSAMTFAPSVDNTDDPNIYDLFILDTTSSGQIVELSLQEPAALPPGTTLLPATQVNIIDTSSWNPPAPDPAGIDYFPLTDRLIISDSEVDEMPIFEGKNVFLSTRSGNLTGTCTTFPFTGSASNPSTGEPTGVAVNPNNNHIFIAADFQDRLFEISLGADGQYCTADDTVTNTSLGTTYGVTDAEDVAYGNNTVFIAGGTDAEVFVIPLGPNGVVGGGDDGPMTHWDTAAPGFSDAEGIGFNHDAGTLFVVSTKRTDKYLGEFTTSGTLLRAYDLSFMPNVGNIRSDVAYAPGSQNPGVKNIYIASRGVDNNSDPNENDGKVWEINISGSGGSNTATPSRTPTATWTPTPGATFTPTRTPTIGPSPTFTRTPTATATSSVSDLIFADGFESGSLADWTSNSNDLGDLSVSGAAALVGSQGMQAVIDDNNPIYVTDDSPNAEPRYRARFYFDPNSIAMLSGEAHFIFKGFAGTSTDVFQVELRSSSGAYQIRAKALNDGSAFVVTNWFTISNATHFIEVDWRASSGVGANNGGLTLWINGVQQADLTGVDNDTWRIDRARLGALAGMDAGTSGTYYFDAFESRRQTYIGP
ncbi:MAG: hypothetical protein ABIQ77_09445 [Anaerolineales bacterium]